MLIATGKLTVGQTAGRTATEHACAMCGESTVILVDVDVAAVDHRCATPLAGAVWTVATRPATAEQLRARERLGGAIAGLVTLEQARAAAADRLERALVEAAVA